MNRAKPAIDCWLPKLLEILRGLRGCRESCEFTADDRYDVYCDSGVVLDPALNAIGIWGMGYEGVVVQRVSHLLKGFLIVAVVMGRGGKPCFPASG